MISALPDAGHLPGFVTILVIAFLSTGLGHLAGADRSEDALVAGWGVASFATLIVGVSSTVDLSIVMAFAAAAGLVGWVVAIGNAARRSPSLQIATFARTLCLGAGLLVILESIDPASWDDFSHWLPNQRYLSFFGHFPTSAAPNLWTAHPGYPYGNVLPGYGAFLLTGGKWFESVGIYWNALVLLAACASIARFLEDRLQSEGQALSGRARWSIAGLSFLAGTVLSPVFTPVFVLSNMSDGPTAAILCMLCASLARMVATRPEMARDKVAVPILLAVALVSLRQTNILLIMLAVFGFVIALLALRQKFSMRDAPRMLLLAVISLASFLIWDLYAKAQIPGGQFAWLPFERWRIGEIGTILSAVLHVMIAKIRFYGMAAAIACACIAALIAGRSRGRQFLVAPVAICLLFAGYLGFLLATYIAADFSDGEALEAASFFRYSAHVGLCLNLAVAVLVPGAWLAKTNFRYGAIALAIISLISPLLMARTIRYDLKGNTPRPLRATADDIVKQWNWEGPLVIADTLGDGADVNVVTYQIQKRMFDTGQPRSLAVAVVRNPTGLSIAQIQDQVRSIDGYLWLSQGSAAVSVPAEHPLREQCSYLLRRQSDGPAIVKSWYRETSGRAEPAAAAARRC